VAFCLPRHQYQWHHAQPQIYGLIKNALMAMIPSIGYDNSRGYYE
jgi:hypothetical protein